ncbi:CaiB/BaiF CoA transferase family protein [Falsiroseomonas sp.]|uniref:CaiB/BaiF CoA transferase family protein n=1 Tax=Falsiroseomonas sp. TaxID=2870721 RepID=UPI0034A4FE36
MARPKPLEGLRVLDLTHVLAGPYCTLFMALNGAEVIKIETPEGGEMARRLLMQARDGRIVDAALAYQNRGKQSLTLNLRSEEGRAIFLDLVRISDVVVENFSATTMKRLGLDYAALRQVNPRIVYTSISGFGHDDILPGPYVDRPAFNLIAQAMGGIMDISGELDGPPIVCGVPLGDLTAGIFGLSGTLLALRQRETTGEGQHVDVAMYDALASYSQRLVTRYYLTGEVPTRGRDNRENPQGIFKVKDGYVAITVMGDPMWGRFCAMLGRPEMRDDPAMNPDTARGKLYDSVLQPMLEAWAAEMTREEVLGRFRAADLPCAPVQDTHDLLNCPHLKARNMIVEVDDPVRGRIAYTGNPIKLSAMPEEQPSHAPALGQDTDAILSRLLGLDAARLEALHARRVI